MMTTDELTEKYHKFADVGGPLHGKFTVFRVDTVNYRVDGILGHPFTIGPRHVAEASDHHSGILGTEVCEKIGCAHKQPGSPTCDRPPAAHTHDTVLMLQLVRDLENAEAAAALFAIKEEMIADKIDGVALVETPDKFRIAPGPKEPTP